MIVTERMRKAGQAIGALFGARQPDNLHSEIEATLRKEVEITEHMQATERTSGFQIFNSVVALMEQETSDALADPSLTKTLEDVRRLQGKKQALNAVLAIVPEQIQRGAEAREQLTGAKE